jgi:SAM-dependent methyltransferase
LNIFEQSNTSSRLLHPVDGENGPDNVAESLSVSRKHFAAGRQSFAFSEIGSNREVALFGPWKLKLVANSLKVNEMPLFRRFSNERRILQLGWYGLRHGTRVFEKLNKTNLTMAKQFNNVEILCNVCGEKAKVWYEMLSVKERREHKVGLLRETLECLNCLSRMRYRIMAHAMLTEFRQRFGIAAASLEDAASMIGNIDILDTDAFSPAARILERNKAYRLSVYMPNRPFGLLENEGKYNVDLQKMTFSDRTFDIILSSDVMEHVRSFQRANEEIFRCLKPGGAHIFTVPFHEPDMLTRTLIDSGSGEDIYLEPPQFHGDAHFSGKIPVYRIYGTDLLDDLRTFGFEADMVRIQDSGSGIFDGLYFIARRPQ